MLIRGIKSIHCSSEVLQSDGSVHATTNKSVCYHTNAACKIIMMHHHRELCIITPNCMFLNPRSAARSIFSFCIFAPRVFTRKPALYSMRNLFTCCSQLLRLSSLSLIMFRTVDFSQYLVRFAETQFELLPVFPCLSLFLNTNYFVAALLPYSYFCFW
jgi:hypothetical protein